MGSGALFVGYGVATTRQSWATMDWGFVIAVLLLILPLVGLLTWWDLRRTKARSERADASGNREDQ
jgi:hypothetical protein